MNINSTFLLTRTSDEAHDFSDKQQCFEIYCQLNFVFSDISETFKPPI